MREAEISIPDEGLDAAGIGELVAHCRSAGQRDIEELSCRGDGAVVLVTVEEPLDPDVLDALAYVESWSLVAGDPGARNHGSADGTDDAADASDGAGGLLRYQIAFTAPGVDESAREPAGDLVGECDPEMSPDGTTVSLVGEQSTIGEAVETYEDAGLSPDLRSLGTYAGEAGPLDALTERQREVLRTAWELGYFDVPREAATDDVAAELDLDPSTVTEHLQRAERNLLGELLGEEP